MDVVFAHLASSTPGAAFVRVRARRDAARDPCAQPYTRRTRAVTDMCARACGRQAEAEALSDVSEKHDVPSVPFFLFFKARHRCKRERE
jgi:hypothetical protein